MSLRSEKALQFRLAAKADVPAMLGIYAPYVRETAYSFEYEVPTEELFAHLRKVTLSPFFARLARCGVEIYLKKIGVSAECGERFTLFDEKGFFALAEVREFDEGIALKPIKQFDIN